MGPLLKQKIFKDKKFFLINSTKLSFKFAKCFDEFKDQVVKNGGIIQYSLQKFNTDYLICFYCDQNDDNVTVNPYLIQNFEKAQSYKIPFLSHTFVEECIKAEKVIDDIDRFRISSIILPPAKFEIILNTPVQEQEENEFLSNFYLGSDTASQKSNNHPQQQRQYESECGSDAVIFDLFGDVENNNSNNNNNNNNNKASEMFKTYEEEFDFTDFFGNIETDSSYTQNENDRLDIVDDVLPLNNAQQEGEEEENWPFGFEEEQFITTQTSSLVLDEPKRIVKYPSWECDKVGGYFYYRKNDSFVLYDQIKNKLRMLSVSLNGLTSLITEDKTLQSWGNLSRNFKLSQPLNVGKKFQSGSLGHNHSLYIDYEKRVWSFGLNENNQLGPTQPPTPTTEKMPMLKVVNLLYNVIIVSCGKNFSAALTSSNSLFTWGKNDAGQLGHGHKNDLHVPTMVNLSVPDYFISDVSCGTSHMMCTLSSKDYNIDTVYAWGSNHNKQVGIWSSKPYQIPLASKGLKRIFAFKNSSIILSEPNNMTIMSSNIFNLSYHKVFESMYDYSFTTIKDSIGIKVNNPFYTVLFLIDKPEKILIVESSIEEAHSKFSNGQIQTLLNICFSFGYLNVFKLLLKYIKPQLLINSEDNQTPLHIAAKYEKSEMLVQHLLKIGVFDIDQPDNQLNTALHICAQYNNQKIAVLLLTNGCSRNLKNEAGSTAMHICVADGKTPLAAVLAKHGTQAIPDKSMKTPLQYMSGEEKQNLQNVIFQNEVFLSYAHRDLGFLRPLRTLFEQRSLRCWLDDYRLQAGCNWKAEITKGVEGSSVVVFIVSETSAHSLWCRKELKMCKKLGKKILPLYYHDVKVDPVVQGLFDYVPYEKVIFSQLDQTQVEREVLNYSIIIKSLIKGEQQIIANQSHSDVIGNNASKLIYLSFNPPDISIQLFLKANFIQKRLPFVSKIDLENVQLPAASDYDKFKFENRKKLIKLNTKLFQERKQQEALLEKEKAEKKRQQFKLDMKVEKRLQKNGITKDHPDYQYFRKDYYEFFNQQKNVSFDLQNGQQQVNSFDVGTSFYSSYMAPPTEVNSNLVSSSTLEIPVTDYNDIPILNETYDTTINSYNTGINIIGVDGESTTLESLEIQNQEKVISTNLDTNLASTIQNSLLHLVIFTLKSDKLLDENFYEEISYSQSLGKTIIVITNNIDSKKFAPDSLKSLTWYEIQYCQEEELFEHIISLYEILEKIQTMTFSIQEIQSK
ncbi:hypothetical protein CYY_004188 [Polysphondylium violaceum]|uniref:Ankyrin repeat-containing protein n=1 Tax=Polysphondylium violaceum TaxID=133409 RepID=A0A8J4UZI7_9MYCE|nr:hypothetical protein CYY_004188 [Polysphondylium violaceum]